MVYMVRLTSLLTVVLTLTASAPTVAQVSETDEAKRLFNVAVVAAETGDYPIAERNLLKAAALVPTSGVIWYNLALIQEKLGKQSEAERNVQTAIKLGLSESDRDVAE